MIMAIDAYGFFLLNGPQDEYFPLRDTPSVGTMMRDHTTVTSRVSQLVSKRRSTGRERDVLLGVLPVQAARARCGLRRRRARPLIRVEGSDDELTPHVNDD